MDDLLYIVTSFFILAVCSVFAYMFITQFSEVAIFQQTLLVNETFDSAQTTYTSTLDTAFLILFVISIAGAMILGHLIPSRPIWFIPFIFTLMFMTIMVGMISNIYYEFRTTSSVSTYANAFPFITHLMDNLPFYFTGLSILLAVVIYTGVPKQQSF